jgi:hypothetical protein
LLAVTMKWPIPGGDGWSQDQRREYWEGEHRDNDYADVFSISQDEVVIAPCLDVVRRRGARSVMVVGCGSNVALQQAVADRAPGVQRVTCVDFPGVVQVAAARTDDPRIEYVGADVGRDGCGVTADVALSINSVLSDSDAENRAILRSIRAALPEGGALAGTFPTILTVVDLGWLQPGHALLDQVDMAENRFTERIQGLTQIFYTPVRLRMVMAEAGLRVDRMAVLFLDSPALADQARGYYGLGDDPDIVAWELFVEATAV